MISDKQVESYRENGYLMVENVIDRDTLAQIKRVIADLVEVPGARPPTMTCTISSPRIHPTIHACVASRNRTWCIRYSTRWSRVERMVSILKRLLGENIRLHGSKLNMKAPHYGSPVEWHQDWAFYPHSNDDILAIGCVLDDMLLENGPLMVMPGTHRGQVWDHHAEGRFCGAMDPPPVAGFLQSSGRAGPAGSCSFHHVRLVHGSAQNTSERSRNLLLYECAAADAWPFLNFKPPGVRQPHDRRHPTIEPRFRMPVRMPYRRRSIRVRSTRTRPSCATVSSARPRGSRSRARRKERGRFARRALQCDMSARWLCGH